MTTISEHDSTSQDEPLLVVEVPDQMKPIVRALAVGRDAELEAQLIVKSQQPHILKFTPNDAHERFNNKANLDIWFRGGRTMHWLLGPENDLAGIMWYRKKQFPKNITFQETPTETFAIRLYEGYVGHHLAQPFMKFSLQIAIRLKRERGQAIESMWLQTTPSNEAAIASYIKFGYQEVYRDAKTVLMVMNAADLLRVADT